MFIWIRIRFGHTNTFKECFGPKPPRKSNHKSVYVPWQESWKFSMGYMAIFYCILLRTKKNRYRFSDIYGIYSFFGVQLSVNFFVWKPGYLIQRQLYAALLFFLRFWIRENKLNYYTPDRSVPKGGISGPSIHWNFDI